MQCSSLLLLSLYIVEYSVHMEFSIQLQDFRKVWKKLFILVSGQLLTDSTLSKEGGFVTAIVSAHNALKIVVKDIHFLTSE